MFPYYFLKKIDSSICSSNLHKKKTRYLIWTWILTFFIYTTYHIARKPISVVKNVLNENCTSVDPTPHNDSYWCDWEPFNTADSSTLLGALDSAYLFAYAFGMFFLSGMIAERSNLNYFLCFGMVASGIFTSAFGLGYTFEIHTIWYYFVVQVFGGLFLSTGWPGVVTVMGNWFGKSKRGLIMGVWNSHTSVGNIIGTLIASAFLESWSMSFIVPGLIIAGLGIFTLFFLAPDPSVVGLDTLDSKTAEGLPTSEIKREETTRLLGPQPIYGSTINTPPQEEEERGSIHSGDAVGVQIPSDTVPITEKREEMPISLMGALRIPGVVEYSASLFFSKLVSYTFLFWLPHFLYDSTDKDANESANLSTFFDVGGIFGAILAGQVSDMTNMPASTCTIMLMAAIPMLFLYQSVAATLGTAASIFMLMAVGLLVNGPYALITTAVSADLGTHPSLRGNSKALSTVTSIIDGTGSFGAAVGPLIAGALSNNGNWSSVFYMLMVADVFSLLTLVRITVKEAKSLRNRLTRID